MLRPSQVCNGAPRCVFHELSNVIIRVRAVLIDELFFCILVKCILKCGGVLSQFVQFDNPGKIVKR